MAPVGGASAPVRWREHLVGLEHDRRVLEKIIERCRDLNLRLTDSEPVMKTDFMVFLTVQTMNYLHSGRHRVAL